MARHTGALLAILALVCDSVVGVIAAGIDLWYAGFVDRLIADPDSVTDAEINSTELVYGLSGLLEFVAYVLAGVAFIVLLFRAEDLESLASAARFDVVSIALTLVAAVLAILVVRSFTEVQEAQRPGLAPVPGPYGGRPAY